MSKFTADDTHFVRIGGVADGSGNVYTFLTRPLGATAAAAWSGTATYGLDSLIESKGAAIKFLGTMTAAPSISVNLRQSGNTTSALLRKKTTSSTVKSGTTGGVIRLTRFVSSAATGASSTLHVTDSAPFTIGVSYWVGAQAFTVTAKPTSTTIAVTRGALGTYAKAIQVPHIRPTIHVHPATPKGLPVTAGVIDEDGSEVVRFRGFVDSVNLNDGLKISIGVRSIVQHMRDAPYSVPVGINAPTPISAGAHPDRDRGDTLMVRGWAPLEVDTEMHGPSVADGGEEWTRVRWVGSGGEWLVTEVTYLDTVTDDNERQIDRYVPPVFTGASTVQIDVYAFGKDGEIYDLQTPRARQEHIEAVFDDLDRGEWCLAYETAPEWSAVLLGLLTRDDPCMSGMGIPADYLSGGDADLPTAGIGLPGTIRNTVVSSDDWVMPTMKSKKWADLFRDGFLRPTFRGFGVDEAARIKALNWLEDPLQPRSVVDITEHHLAGDASYKMTDHQTTARGAYVLKYGFMRKAVYNSSGDTIEETDQSERVIISGDANQGDLAQADTIEIPGTLAGSLGWRLHSVELADKALKLFGVAVPQITMQVQPTVSASPGQRVTVSRRDIPSHLGIVDPSSQVVVRGFVLGSGIDGGRLNDLTIAITGYVADPRPTRGTWAPYATITAWDAGTKRAAIEANEWTSPSDPGGVVADWMAWDILDYAAAEVIDVLICDSSLATLGTATIDDVSPSTGLRVTSPTVTPAVGNVLVPVAWDSQTAEAKAATYQQDRGAPIVHLAGSDATIGAAADAGFGWQS